MPTESELGREIGSQVREERKRETKGREERQIMMIMTKRRRSERERERMMMAMITGFPANVAPVSRLCSALLARCGNHTHTHSDEQERGEEG